MTGTIFDIKEMALHDGPGIRTTIFFKGCPLRCKWCHNPEGLVREKQLMYKKARCKSCGNCLSDCNHKECADFGRCIYKCPENCLEVSGRTVKPENLAKELIQGADVLRDSFGGFTFSGGEPLMQKEFLLELAGCLDGYHLCVETSGYADQETFRAAVDAVDLVIMDVKIADNELHKKYTGVGNELIFENLKCLFEGETDYIIRTPMVPGITDTDENLAAIEKLIGGSCWEKLPYNNLAGAKYSMLGMEFQMNIEL